MTRDYEKPFILMCRGSLTSIRNVCWNNCGFSPQIRWLQYFPAGALWNKKAFAVSFNKVLREKSYNERDLLEMLEDHLMYHYSLSENTQNQHFD